MHLLAAVTHVTGLVIGQDKVPKSGAANEVTHFRLLLEPQTAAPGRDGHHRGHDADNQGQCPLAVGSQAGALPGPVPGNQPGSKLVI